MYNIIFLISGLGNQFYVTDGLDAYRNIKQ